MPCACTQPTITLLPIYVALGAADENASFEVVHRGMTLGALAMDAYLFSTP
jgi:aromatic ring-opening dioxygenase catalytic subunit (LigB family)